MKPTPVFLKAGDVVTLGIEKLGEQRQKVVAAEIGFLLAQTRWEKPRVNRPRGLFNLGLASLSLQ